jgi:hypothetical protein
MRCQVLGHGIVACWLVLFGTLLAQAQTKKIEIQKRVDVERRVEPVGRVSAEFPRASSIIGARVSIQGDVAIGKVEDLVLNQNGTVEYLVVLNEDKYVLVPWAAAKLDPGQRTVVVEIRQEKFREVPTFTRESWPNFSDTQYIERINTYYGVKPGRDRRIERREDRREDRRDR